MSAKTVIRTARPALAALMLLCAACGKVQSGSGTAASERQATVAVDFGESLGARVRAERVNNLSRATTFAEQRAADVEFYNAQGLHGEIYRVWVDASRIHDEGKGSYDYEGVDDYLADASRLSDRLLIVMDTRVEVRDLGHTPAQIKPVIKTIMRELKQRFPRIEYVEAFNEPDHNLGQVLTPEQLYDYYRVYYEAVNEINRELKPEVPLQVGGPAFMMYNEPWMRVFLDRYQADPSPDKRLDFISYHAYGEFPPGDGSREGPRAFHFYKGNPGEVADQRTRLEEELRSRGLDTDTPSFITELGIYPGPSFDTADDPHPDYLRQASGVSSLLYWFMEQRRTVPFNWVLRHVREERKDQLLTRAGEGRPVPTGIFTPYGNSMRMMSMLKDERVAARSDSLIEGKGIYAVATKDGSGAALMLWNYQHTGTEGYRVTVDMGELPAELRGKALRQRMYRIDERTSNYWGDPSRANLQQVSDALIEPGASHKLSVELSANALQLVVLEPATAGASAASIRVEAGSLPFVRRIDERFQSFQVGMSHLTGGETWRSYDASRQEGESEQAKAFDAVREPREPADLGSPRLRTLTAALGPLYLRYGGTTSNSVYFQDDDGPRLARAPEGYSTVLTRKAWKGGLDFAKAVDAKVVTGFTVSEGVRDESGVWTPEHAAPWLAYTQSIGGEIYAAELFNEPNAPEPGRMPEGQSAEAFARDFAAFSAFMKKAAPDVKLAGPGVATLGVPIPVSSLERVSPEQYLSAEPRPQFDMLSYHFYGAIAERCAPPDSPAGISADRALSEAWLARPDGQFQKHRALRDRYAPGAPIWLTETGAAACGGTRWQPTFLDSFRYLDTQARLAKQGLDAIFTHALISGSNGVIDEKTFMPNASYWAALLWRRLMGTQVLDAGPTQPRLHVYAHCQQGTPGGVTVLALNLQDSPARVGIAGPVDLYALTADELQSRSVRLNGQPLVLDADDRLPTIAPTRLHENEIELAPTSVNFLVLPQAGNPGCRG